MTEYDPHEAINYIYTHAPKYAEAKGQLAQLEAYKSSLFLINILIRSSVSLFWASKRTTSSQPRLLATPMYQSTR